MEATSRSLVNAIVLIRYTNGRWAKKNYFGFPTDAFFDLLDEMISSDFTEYVISVYYSENGSFERAVLEKGGWKEFKTIDELKTWLKERGNNGV